MMSIQRSTLGLLVGTLMLMASAGRAAPPLVTEEFRLPTEIPGITLYLRNKHPADLSKFRAERTVLFVHGATYPAETAFDFELDGLSWMDFIAQRGFDVYLVDIRGYGRSTRPPEMSQPADKNAPIVSTAVAVGDVGRAVNYIRQRREIDRISLLGWSWGTILMASYSAEHPNEIARLVLYAPGWLRTTPSLVQAADKLGAYRTVTREQALQRWLTGVPDDKKASLIPAGWFDQWADATFATDPEGAKLSAPVLRAPNGVVEDGRTYWSAGKATYDPALITAPVLLIRADWDQDTPAYMAQGLFQLLVNAPSKRWVTIGEGTHTVMMEKNRMQLFREVQLFLEEPTDHE